jgi:hypothetical protein
MSGCDAVLRWGESGLIHTHRALRSGRIELRNYSDPHSLNGGAACR